tara:strand:+ start:10343 stop:10552 length:210 start_codon:yes stop_codon:yes gene_type:complete
MVKLQACIFREAAFHSMGKTFLAMHWSAKKVCQNACPLGLLRVTTQLVAAGINGIDIARINGEAKCRYD